MPTLDNPQANPDIRRRIGSPYAQYKQTRPGSAKENEMVQEYLPLVKNVVGRLAMSLPPHVDVEDLYSAGLVGLLNAIRNFDPQGGSTFESYARVRIRGTIFDELRRMDWVPRSVHDKARKVQTVMQQLEQAKGEAPSEAEMAKAMGMTVEAYEDLMTQIRPATFVCLDAVHGGEDNGDTSYHETITDESQADPVDSAARRELSKVIETRLKTLPEMQRKVLALYYFEDMRLREIAEVFGVTESRICQIHSQAILSLRGYLQKFSTPRG